MNNKISNIKIEGLKEFSEVQNQLFRRGVESLLDAEISAHLSHFYGDKPSLQNVRYGYSNKPLKI